MTASKNRKFGFEVYCCPLLQLFTEAICGLESYLPLRKIKKKKKTKKLSRYLELMKKLSALFSSFYLFIILFNF